MADRTDPLMGDLRTEQSVDQHARQARAFDEVGPHRRPAPVRSRLTELDTPLNTACRVPTPMLWCSAVKPRSAMAVTAPSRSIPKPSGPIV